MDADDFELLAEEQRTGSEAARFPIAFQPDVTVPPTAPAPATFDVAITGTRTTTETGFAKLRGSITISRMKRLSTAVLTAVLAFSGSVRAEGPDDKYIEIYEMIQEAGQIEASQPGAARLKYSEARTELQQLQTAYPTWNEKLVQYRLRMLDNKLGGAAKTVAPAVQTPAPAAAQPAATATPMMSASPTLQPVAPSPSPNAMVPAAAPNAMAPAPLQPDFRDAQIKALQEQVAGLQRDRGLLEAKLREALSAQPAAVDPRELNRAEERIRQLEKDKEVLKVSVDVAEAKAAHPIDTGAESKRQLAAAQERLRQQDDLIAALRQEKEVLNKRVEDTRKSDEQIASNLRAENDRLKQQLTAQVGAAPAGRGAFEKELASTQAALQSTRETVASLQVRMRSLEEERDRLDRTRLDLERQLAAAKSAAAAPESAQVKQLRLERDALQQRVAEMARKPAPAPAPAAPAARVAAGPGDEVSGLRARIQVLEAHRIPYTAEELALFKQPQDGAVMAAESAQPKPGPDATAKLGPLLAEAQTAFASRRFDEAEKKYQEALQLDNHNPSTLQRLAASQLEQGHPKEAEANLQQALQQAPSDPHTLLLLGIAQFDQEKFDAALDTLSRSAALDPQNPETQNYLGITLSQRGQRAAAETALRKAIQIDPGYKSAHYNLAVVYATQKPPFLELARWHYQKALAYGHPRSEDLEKLLEQKPAAK